MNDVKSLSSGLERTGTSRSFFQGRADVRRGASDGVTEGCRCRSQKVDEGCHHLLLLVEKLGVAACAADRRVVTVLCAMLCQQPFVPHNTTSQETRFLTERYSNMFKKHKPREQDRQGRKVLRKCDGSAHALSGRLLS